ncbi:hypothetical protein AAZX31_14G103900 [Glycine max]
MTIKYRVISFTSFQSKHVNNMTKFTKPSTRRLLQPIERSMKLTHKAILPLSNKPRWLLHINILLKITVEKGILNIKLMEGPVTNSSHSKKQTNSGEFGDRRESITVINAIYLCVAFSYQTSLKPINLTSGPNFNSVDPPTTHRGLTRGKRNKLPSTIIFKGLHFINHSLSPARMIKCLTDSGRNGKGRQ